MSQRPDLQTPGGEVMPPGGSTVAPWQPIAGKETDRAMAMIIVAQKCPVKRELPAVKLDIQFYAQEAAEAYYYRWPVKNKDGTTVYIEGPTIKLANDLARIYGNCRVDTDMFETPTHYVFTSTFSDYQTGYQLNRMFKQRKSQSRDMGGRMDAARAEDIVFQIGQSKSIRNVIVNALRTLADMALVEAKNSLVKRIGKDLPKARNWLVGQYAAMEVDVVRVARIVGKAPDKWGPHDMARLTAEVQAIKDGMATPDDLYPEPDSKESDELADATKKDAVAEGDRGEAEQPESEVIEGQATEVKEPDKPAAETKTKTTRKPRKTKATAAKAAEPPPDTGEVVDPETGEVMEPEPERTKQQIAEDEADAAEAAAEPESKPETKPDEPAAAAPAADDQLDWD